MLTDSLNSNTQRNIVLSAIHHLDHLLPGQAPIHDFVHHNTLHGFQHLPFEKALSEFSELTGIPCYLPIEQFRTFHHQGRISLADIDAALAQHFGTTEQSAITTADGKIITRFELYKLAMLFDLRDLTPAQFNWQMQAMAEQSDAKSSELCRVVLDKLELQMPNLHPENLLDLSNEQSENWLPDQLTVSSVKNQMEKYASNELNSLFDGLGDRLTFRGLLQALTGNDILDKVRPQLIRQCASLLDEGLAAWRLPHRQTLGLYSAWRQNLAFDAHAIFSELNDWQTITESLPEDSIEAIIQQLDALALPQARWPGYLNRLALELPGWSGLINWRQTHPAYSSDDGTQPLLADYLAVRLVLDRLYLQTICRELWHCDARIDKLQVYFSKYLAEFTVRTALFQGDLPEYLAQEAQDVLTDSSKNRQTWQLLAERLWTWRNSPLTNNSGSSLSVYNQAWRLFRVSQLLGLSADSLEKLDKVDLLNWLTWIDGFSEQQQSLVWLIAYERNYQQALLQALHANYNRGRWARREHRPDAQIVFCMDDREEGIRRHLEELNPAIETLGAAGFFGVPMNFQGLDDTKLTPLCPVVVTPSHNVEERSQSGQDWLVNRHRQGLKFKQRMSDLLHHGLRRNLLLSFSLINFLAPATLLGLLAKSFFPKVQQLLMAATTRHIVVEVDTRLNFTAENNETPATPEQPRLGFTDQEQADRIAGFLRNTGLTYGFAELVVLMGHGSMSQNNPHLAAYDCGACSGRHGGPNARLFAAMANRPVVRRLLAEKGIVIPDDTWFVGAEHNTCDEAIDWYDRAELPSERRAKFEKFVEQMQHAQRMSAVERCRRLASAPRKPTPYQALKHFLNRAADFSQARPELGHATNAAALVGRRSLTQGAFFDRRLFLISYDPSQDPDGTVLEGILLAVGPVGAGINLEYYFSTVNNERLGCGSKVPHNLTGFFAVMEGAGSDLRTGLPRQMIEIHEAMRLQIIVEAKTSVLEQIYARQESLRELIGGGWVHLSAKDPDSDEIYVFQREIGFVRWQPLDEVVPMRQSSSDCYREETQPVAPMLIMQPEFGSR